MSKLNNDKVDNECIQVVVRCRPMNKKENDEKRSSIINVDCEARTITIRNPENLNEVPKTFTYDATYDDKTQQRIFYDESCFSVIEGTLEGFNSTIFAYGQTGCGKSFTMQGPSTTNDEMKGVIPNSFSHIFDFVKSTKEIEFLIRCQYLELYNEEIKDLLTTIKNAPKLDLREDPQKGVYVNGITDVVVESAEDLNKMLDRGLSARTTAATLMNAESSRSHSIFTIIIEMSTKDQTTGKDMLRVGKLNLVDLAGSERQKKTGAKDATLKEGIKINLSLSALGNVISALSEGANGRHIPYRDSKLTRLLQDSLGGNTKTMMIAAISPADYNLEETMSTLRYASRAKNIKNKPKINEDPKDAMIREFKEEIAKLRSMLAQQSSGMNMNDNNYNNITASNSNPSHTQQQEESLYKSYQDNSTYNKSSPLKTVTTTQSNNNSLSITNNDELHHNNSHMIEDSSPNPYSPDRDHYQYSAKETSSNSNNNTNLQQQQQSGKERLDAENRLHQLEHLLVHHHLDENDMDKNSPIYKSSSTTTSGGASVSKQQPKLLEIETAEEAAATKKYQQKRLDAKKKKEAAKQREMQRILEEKKNIEMELEELRSSSQTNRMDGNNSSMNDADIDAIVMKKVNKLKKKYEKKLLNAQEELYDLREDFYYQRKQLVEAAMEQEKDSKLYEAICQSVLPDKELRKILDKCKYDEDADEWILPFTKKKNLKDITCSSSGGSGGGGSMLPDIFNKNIPSQNINKNDNKNNLMHESMSSTIRDPKSVFNNNNNKSGSTTTVVNRISMIPLLTLPGNMVTSASLMDDIDDEQLYSNGYEDQLSPRWQQQQQQPSPLDSTRLQNIESAPISSRVLPIVDVQQQQKPKKKKTTKPKDQQSNTSAADDTSNNDFEQYNNIITGGYDSSRVPTDPEAGSGLSAGPLNDWGFLESSTEGNGKAYNGIGFNGPELEYYDDDDFENVDDTTQSISQQKIFNPYPPSNANNSQQASNKIRKKKNKVNNDYTSKSLDQNTNVNGAIISKPSIVTSLPPI